LVVAALLTFAVAGPVAFHLGGPTALTASAVAGALCLVGAATALLTSHLLRGPDLAIVALLVGMVARMGLPLTVGFVIHLQGGPLAAAGLLYYLLVYYSVTLTAETILSLPPSRRPPRPADTASNNVS
jgi:hypothetical protein